MELNEKDIKKISVLILISILAVLVFILIRPIALSIIGGLILAYTFFPIYKRLLPRLKSRGLTASIVSLIVVLLIVIPLYFITPLMVNQVFGLFKYAQTLDLHNFLLKVFPSAPEPFIVQMTTSLNSIIGKISSAVLNQLIDLFLNIPLILFNFAIVAFVFFFALRDSDKLAEFMSNLSPLNKTQEKKLVQKFKDITNSIVYGQIVIGLVQGITAAVGLFLFGVPHALVLSILAIVLSVIPLIGPSIIWIPSLIYVFLQGNTLGGFIYLFYNLIVVSNIDNLLRLYLITKKTSLSQAIVLIGMIGGLFIFGILGLIIGPLLLEYFITFLNAYKENNLSSLFNADKDENV